MSNSEQLKDLASQLNLGNIRKNADHIIHEAQMKKPNYLEFLEGNISDDTDDNLEGNLGGNKEAVLRKLMYWPTLYLQLDEVKINNKNIFIPKEFGQPYELRSETFIKIG